VEIAVVADTHGFFDPQFRKALSSVDEVWHAGDFGTIEVADQFSALKPLRGVHGNIDDSQVRARFPEELAFEIENLRVFMTHIAGQPGKYQRHVAAKLRQDQPDVLICGHSHALAVMRDQRFGGMLFLNPGAAGHHGFHLQRTFLKCRIANGAVDQIRVVELGARGRRTKHNEGFAGDSE
jgi:putative phosphoesterase